MNFSRHKSVFNVIKQERFALWIFVAYSLGLVILWNIFDLKNWLLSSSLKNWPWYVGPLFTLLYLVRGFFYFPSLYFIIAASLLFPFPLSVFYYLAGVYGSAVLSYQIGNWVRFKGHFPKLLNFVEHPDIQLRIKSGGLRTVFWLHLTGVSLDIPNYLSGYLRLPFIKFLAVVIVTNAITTALYFTLFHAGFINLVQ